VNAFLHYLLDKSKVLRFLAHSVYRFVVVVTSLVTSTKLFYIVLRWVTLRGYLGIGPTWFIFNWATRTNSAWPSFPD